MKQFKQDGINQSWEYAQAVKQQRKQSKQLRSQKKERKSIWINVGE
jgi:hypothetical protein